MLTIGDLARLAGTTVRAVRHYHAIGLLDEPPRDKSGYRRYGSAALIRVLRIRRMREIGLPLDRIGELLGGPVTAMHAALDELDAELAEQAEQIAARRTALARLRAAGTDPELPGRLGALQAKAIAEGVPERALAVDKEFLLMDLALHPERADELIAEYERNAEAAYAQPGFAQLFARFDALADHEPDPAELDAVAREIIATIRDAELDQGRGDTSLRAERLIADWATSLPPTQRKLMERVVELAAQQDRAQQDRGQPPVTSATAASGRRTPGSRGARRGDA